MKSLPAFVSSICLLASCLLFAACPNKVPVHSIPPGNIGEVNYLDLKPGWRLRVVVPIVRTGGYIVPMTTETGGHGVSVTAGKDFLGYETDYYDVESTHTGVKIKFRRAEAIVQGKKSTPAQPVLRLFNTPEENGYLRIVYMIRESGHDHNTVVVSCVDEKTLHDLSPKVMAGNIESCQTYHSVCVQIPTGVAVIPEEKIREGGKDQWKAVL